jgi:rRNA maturation endonuclease Nob1
MEYRIECHECENESLVQSFEEPEYCPVCGIEIEPIKIEEPLDWVDEE